MATYWENSCSFGLRYVSWYECLIVSLVFSLLGFWSGNLFLIAPFPDLCLLVPFHIIASFTVTQYLLRTVFAKMQETNKTKKKKKKKKKENRSGYSESFWIASDHGLKLGSLHLDRYTEKVVVHLIILAV